MNTGHFSKKCSANHRTAKTTNNNTSLNWKIDLSEQHPVKTPTGSKSRRSTGYGCAGTSSQLKNSLPCSPQSRTAMRFGDLPPWAIEISNSIRELVLLSDPALDPLHLGTYCGSREARPLPSHLLWREPLFDQLIANAYQPGEGICAHVDLLRFEDGIAIVSLESSCVMHFTQVKEAYCDIADEGRTDPPMTKIPVYLTPGSLILMSEEARYCWKHEINRKPGFQIWEGQELNQRRRISVTLRKLCKVE
ncbi:uncharacterized protein LOC133850985 isoform X2 [Alnus glutinosa]|uniref:uncharacterized protein LOC133850985 isoform X2 n=1 Tax=Alnus glutinosa TaxID=3517 RepID=UPI002D7988B7|nr:uncharacterized protein LOC133850985 isoform X2 [Alnus glutinosa]